MTRSTSQWRYFTEMCSGSHGLEAEPDDPSHFTIEVRAFTPLNCVSSFLFVY